MNREDFWNSACVFDSHLTQVTVKLAELKIVSNTTV